MRLNVPEMNPAPLSRCFPMLAVALLCGRGAAGDLAVTGDFDNGRIEVLSIDQRSRTIRTTVPKDDHSQDPRMRFWHYKVTGITPGEELTLEHAPARPIHHLFSYDGQSWHRFPLPGMAGVKFRPGRPELYVCPTIPYPYGRSLRLAEELSRFPHVRVGDLTTSEEGRAVKILTVTDETVPPADKAVVWLLARQHAFEGPSSLVAEGFAKWSASNDEAAGRFRRRIVAFVVPVMDVDNVSKGMTGKGQRDDFNRVWDREPAPWKAVEAARKRIRKSASEGRMLALIDSHNPYYDQGPHWHVAARRDAWERFSREFQTAVVQMGRTNWHDMEVEALEETAPQGRKQGSARAYAFRNWGKDADFIAATLESAHHRDSEGRFMTEQGYLQWGAALGVALERYTK